MLLVNKMNHRLRVPFLSSPLDSAQPTLPAGYSPAACQLRHPTTPCHSQAFHAYERGERRTANAHADKEAPRRQHVEHADRLALVVGARGEGREDDEDDGRQQQRVVARPVVRGEAKDELADDGTGKGDVGDVLGGLRVLVHVAVLQLEDGVDRANDLDISCQSDSPPSQAIAVLATADAPGDLESIQAMRSARIEQGISPTLLM